MGRMHVLRGLGVSVVLLLALALTGCATTLRGQVLDAQTGQPIPGAVVLGVWTKGGGLPGLPHTDLVGVREAETDTEGRFELERLVGLFLEESITVYKFGYVGWNNGAIFPSWKLREKAQIPERIPLETFPPEGNHREHMRFVNYAASLFMYEHERNPKFQRAIEREGRMP